MLHVGRGIAHLQGASVTSEGAIGWLVEFVRRVMACRSAAGFTVAQLPRYRHASGQ